MNHRECLGDYKICEILRQLFFNSYFLETECKIWKSKYTPKSFFFFQFETNVIPILVITMADVKLKDLILRAAVLEVGAVKHVKVNSSILVP